MIFYSPLDGDAVTNSIKSRPRECFLITRLGKPRPRVVEDIRRAVIESCSAVGYGVIDANERVTGRDFLLKIWQLIAATPLSVAVINDELPDSTKANIFYELGVAQALGKETLIIRSKNANVPSDFVRSEHLIFDRGFSGKFKKFLGGLSEQAEHYAIVAEQLDRNPILALDYLRRAYLITGNSELRKRAKVFLKNAGVDLRAKNSIEQLAAAF